MNLDYHNDQNKGIRKGNYRSEFGLDKPFDEDGWYHTRDRGQLNEDGSLTVLGRLDNMFISGGENVYPAEIESVLSAHPSVMEAAVVGVPHETWGEIGRAFVVVADGYNEKDLRFFLAERLAKYKLPRSIIVLESLPLTAIGKLDKKLLTALEILK